MKTTLAVLAHAFAATGFLTAQVGPFAGSSGPLTSVYQGFVSVPAGSASTLLSVTVDAPAAGQETMDVLVGDPSVVVSLIRPDSSEITPSNTAAQTIGWNQAAQQVLSFIQQAQPLQ